jgi:hypothetical protein
MHRCDNSLQCFQRQTLFENERSAQPEGNRATHGEIVDGALNRERADVSPAEQERLDNERIGGDRQANAIDGNDGLIFEAVQKRIAERGKKDLLEQFRAQLAAAAVAKQNALAGGKRHGTGKSHEIFRYVATAGDAGIRA